LKRYGVLEAEQKNANKMAKFVASWWLISFVKNKVFPKYGVAVSAAVKIVYCKLPLINPLLISPSPPPSYRPSTFKQKIHPIVCSHDINTTLIKITISR